MPVKKELIEKAIDTLHEKAETSADLAEAQRKIADKQHEGAHKLELLKSALEHDANELQEKLDQQPDDPLPKKPAATPPARTISRH